MITSNTNKPNTRGGEFKMTLDGFKKRARKKKYGQTKSAMRKTTGKSNKPTNPKVRAKADSLAQQANDIRNKMNAVADTVTQKKNYTNMHTAIGSTTPKPKPSVSSKPNNPAVAAKAQSFANTAVPKINTGMEKMASKMNYNNFKSKSKIK
jgi:hypothetical protein